MAIPVATALGKRDRLWPAVAVSLVAHAGLVAWGLARTPPASIDLEQKPIVAKLVRLGEKRPEEFLPRKVAPPPPAPPAPAPAAAPEVATAVKPPAPAKPAPSAPPKPPPPAAPPAAGRAGGTTLASVLSKVQRDVEDQRYGSPDGDPLGDSDTGAEGDQYLALIQRELQANYVLPTTLSQREVLHLSADLVLQVDASGRIVGHAFERRSGNGAYDAALVRAIEASRLPPPPPELRERFRKEGLGVKFHL